MDRYSSVLWGWVEPMRGKRGLFLSTFDHCWQSNYRLYYICTSFIHILWFFYKYLLAFTFSGTRLFRFPTSQLTGSSISQALFVPPCACVPECARNHWICVRVLTGYLWIWRFDVGNPSLLEADAEGLRDSNILFKLYSRCRHLPEPVAPNSLVLSRSRLHFLVFFMSVCLVYQNWQSSWPCYIEPRLYPYKGARKSVWAFYHGSSIDCTLKTRGYGGFTTHAIMGFYQLQIILWCYLLQVPSP